MLQNNSTLKSYINNLWNTFWTGGISNPLTAIEQITYLLFMKRLDDMEDGRLANVNVKDQSFISRFSGTYIPYVNESLYDDGLEGTFKYEERTQLKKEIEKAQKPRSKAELRWSYFKEMESTAMLEHVRFNVFPFVKALNGSTSPFTKHMANAVFIIEKPSLLSEAIKQIELIFQEIKKDATEGGHAFQDIQGDVYEMLLNEIATAGKNGQFRTPRHIIKLIADLVNPKYGDRIADPACGTGGFLLGAYQYILSGLAAKEDKKLIIDNDGFQRGTISSGLTLDAKKKLENSFFGYDIDITMVRLGLMNLMMHGIDNPNIDYKDTLSKSYNEKEKYDIVMANPPFTGSIDKSDINEELKLQTTKTELLFIERIYNMLKIGGVAAIIVPQGVLFGVGKAFIQLRKKIVEEAELNAVITMPSGVFKPYAGVSTSILIFTKGKTTKNTWFYNMKDDSYELNDKRNEKYTNEGVRDYGDLQDIVTKFRKRNHKTDLDRKAQCFFVPVKEIQDNNYDLSMNKYQEHIFEEMEYKNPEEIFNELEKLEETIQGELKILKDMLA